MPDMVTDFDNNGQMPRALHDGVLLLCVVVNDELGRQSDTLKEEERIKQASTPCEDKRMPCSTVWSKTRMWRYFVGRCLVLGHFNAGTELLPLE
jgi:hypothetical protein